MTKNAVKKPLALAPLMVVVPREVPAALKPSRTIRGGSPCVSFAMPNLLTLIRCPLVLKKFTKMSLLDPRSGMRTLGDEILVLKFPMKAEPILVVEAPLVAFPCRKRTPRKFAPAARY